MRLPTRQDGDCDKVYWVKNFPWKESTMFRGQKNFRALRWTVNSMKLLEYFFFTYFFYDLATTPAVSGIFSPGGKWEHLCKSGISVLRKVL